MFVDVATEDLNANGIYAYTLPATQPLVTSLWDVEEVKNAPYHIFRRRSPTRTEYTLEITSSWLRNDPRICIYDGGPDFLPNEDFRIEDSEMEVAFEIYRPETTSFKSDSGTSRIDPSSQRHLPVYQGTALDFIGHSTSEPPVYRASGFPWFGQNHIFMQSRQRLDSENRFAFTAIPLSSPSTDIEAFTFFHPVPDEEPADPSLVAFDPFSGRFITYVEYPDEPSEIRIVDFLLPAACL